MTSVHEYQSNDDLSSVITAGAQGLAVDDASFSFKTALHVVLVHGAGGDGDLWRYVANKLACHDHLTQPVYIHQITLPHHHASANKSPDAKISMIAQTPSITAYAAQLADYCHRHDLQRVVLVGHSLGSLIGLETAFQLKNRLLGLILMGTADHLKVHPKLLDLAQNDVAAAATLIGKWGFHDGEHHGQTMTDMTRLMVAQAPMVLYHDLKICDEYDECVVRLQQLITPDQAQNKIHLILGEFDRMTPIAAAKEMINLIPPQNLTVIPHSGHMMMLEQPDLCCAALLRLMQAMLQPQSV